MWEIHRQHFGLCSGVCLGVTHDAQLVDINGLASVHLHRATLDVKSPHLVARVVVAQVTLDRGLCLDLGAERVGDGAVKLVEHAYRQQRVDVSRLDERVERRSQLDADAAGE